MPIKDKNNNDIINNIALFPESETVRNIEFGAGRSYYGKKEFPNCFTTEKNELESINHFSSFDSYDENTICHFHDNSKCDFFDYNFSRTFTNIIICNPYGYGVSSQTRRKRFFNRLGDLLDEEGRVHILGRHTNQFSKYENLDKFLQKEQYQEGVNYKFRLVEYSVLDENSYENLNYRFYKTSLNKLTIPTEKIIIELQ